jgi:hypothetical protein
MKRAHRTTPLGISLLIAALGTLAVAGCERRLDASKAPRDKVAQTTVTTTVTTTSDVPSSGNLIGTPPAPPTRPEGAPPETTPVDQPLTASSTAASNELTTYEETRKMPLPGQPNDHSNVASDGSQRAGQVDPLSMPPRAEGPNPPQRDSQTASQYNQPSAQPSQPAADQPAPK